MLKLKTKHSEKNMFISVGKEYFAENAVKNMFTVYRLPEISLL